MFPSDLTLEPWVTAAVDVSDGLDLPLYLEPEPTVTGGFDLPGEAPHPLIDIRSRPEPGRGTRPLLVPAPRRRTAPAAAAPARALPRIERKGPIPADEPRLPSLRDRLDGLRSELLNLGTSLDERGTGSPLRSRETG